MLYWEDTIQKELLRESVYTPVPHALTSISKKKKKKKKKKKEIDYCPTTTSFFVFRNLCSFVSRKFNFRPVS